MFWVLDLKLFIVLQCRNVGIEELFWSVDYVLETAARKIM